MNSHYLEKQIGELKVIELPGDPTIGTIVLLHGFGADAFDLVPLGKVYSGPVWIFPQAPFQIPISPSYMGRAWFPVDVELLIKASKENRFDEIADAFPPEIEKARKTLDDFLFNLNISRSRLILGGFSQGAILAVETLLNSFERCGGLLIFSGTLIHQEHWKRLAHNQAKTPFFQSHGSSDPLLPIKNAQDLEKLLLAGGLEGQLLTFQGGHEIPTLVLKQLASFLKGLFSNRF